ncbi:MAG: response regulator [Thermodesulfobacteriota bacterium]|nr:response regulator [Thermodesulfobacteriota bacterium]
MDLDPRILVVDDEPRMCQTIEILLERRGFDVEAVESGIEALDAMNSNHFDLFLLDVCMPTMDGFRLMEETLHREPEAPVIMMTGNASIESAIRAIQEGAYDYLRKPFEPEDLIKTVKNALEQKRLKDENRAIHKQLILSERRYRYLIQNSPDLIYTLDNEGRFTFVNKAFEKLLGYGALDLIGKPYYFIVHQNDHEKARGLFEQSRKDYPTETGLELRLMSCKDSEQFKEYEVRHLTIALKATATCNAFSSKQEKRLLATHGVARDISYRKHLESQLRQAQKMEAVGTLAGGIAHDFNNVLMEIQGYTSLLLRDCTDPSHSNHKKLKSIENHVQSGAELTRQLLGFAKPGKGNAKPVNVNKLVKETSSMFGRTKKGISITARLQTDVWSTEVDKGQIKQVLLNLYVNSCQAMPKGGEIRLETENVAVRGYHARNMGLAPGKYVKVSVVDTGIGMSKETQQRIFEPFFTTKKRGHGTGLGLATVYSIVKSHEGAIQVFSRKGKGTTFVICLPAAERGTMIDSERSNKVPPGTETLLLVDDEKGVLEVTQEMLKSMGYRVMTARSGPEAIKVFGKNKDDIDLVILDMVMPGMSGRVTLDHMMRLDPSVSVLLSTGCGLKGQSEKDLERDCNGFIQKPFSMEQLSEKIRAVFSQQKASRRVQNLS